MVEPAAVPRARSSEGPAAAPPPPPSPSLASVEELSSPAATSAPISLDEDLDELNFGALVLPSTMEILATSIPTVKRVPQQCRVPITKAFTKLMRQCSTEGTQEQQVRAWRMQFLFFKCVLRMQPEIRGGKKKKLRRNENLRAGLLDRLKRWNEGRVDSLCAKLAAV